MWPKIKNGAIVIIGFLLSPLSWWNDLIINIPLAYFVAYAFAHINQRLFTPTLIVAYWLTNIVGIILMHHGIKSFTKNNHSNKDNGFVKNLLFSLLYTILIVILIKFEYLKLPQDFYNPGQ